MLNYAVIGNPVQHSLSPTIHQIFARQTNINLEYQKLAPAISDFKKTVTAFFDAGGNGCNITVPFKNEALAIANHASESARIAQAANCLTLAADNTLHADNFDGVGLTQDLSRNQQYNINQKTILIIGAGGATQGILTALLEKLPTQIIIANRTAAKAIMLAERFQPYGNVKACALHDIPEQAFDLIIHSTSLGHQGQAPVLPNTIINHDSFCYDLSYGAAAKPFLSWAESCGAAHCSDGIGMLIEQAAASFYRWHGTYPDTHIKIP